MPFSDTPHSLADIGDLGTRPVTEAQKERRRRFVRLWDPTKAGLEARKWTHHPGSIVQLYAEAPSGHKLSWIWISPQDECLRLRLTFDDDVVERRAWAALHHFQPVPELRVAATELKVRRTEGVELAIQLQVRLSDLFNGAEGSRELGDRIATFILAIVDAAEQV